MGKRKVGVAIDGASGSFDRLYSYAVPEALLSSALPGCRVTVPFGRGDAKRQGMIFSVSDDCGEKPLKELYGVTDSEPALNDEMLKICEWLKEHTFCSYFDAVHTVIPAGLNYKLADYYSADKEFSTPSLLETPEREVYDYLCENGETPLKELEKRFDNADSLLERLEELEAVFRTGMPVRRMGDLTQRFVRVCADEETVNACGLTARQRELADIVAGLGECSVKELLYFTGASASVVNALIKKGVFESYEKEVFRMPPRRRERKNTPIILTPEQQTAFDGLCAGLSGEKADVSLLFGVTGSGKTQVFLRLVDRVSSSGRGVIVMVPEIALTPQMIEIFSSRYGDSVAVLHSAMSIGRRMDEYKRIRQGKALIAIGTRSAVFAPFSDLGLIIMDEEQEHTYKSEKAPRFHARELAKFRAGYHKAMLCLASATPSLETYGAALTGRYRMFSLTQRYGAATLPEVTMVDMRKEIAGGNSGSISGELYSAIENALKNGKQAIVLLNRRGHNTYITCPSCGYVATCPNCSISLTYHSANHRLMCHYCGYSEEQPKKCPQCGSEIVRFLGAGTQKVEEELKAMLPNAHIARMDADSTMTRDSYSKYFSAFAAGEYDILLGTQMVAKGLDFPNVTVVGVIGADRAAYSEDYRGFERTFSLLTQVIGRAGRGESPGRAIIQTTDPQSNIVSLAKTQDYEAFYNEEIMTRKVMVFPPFCDICVICVQSPDRNAARETADRIFGNIKNLLSGDYKDIRIIILGPAAAAVPKINNRYRFRLTVKCRDSRRFREMLRKSTDIRLKSDVSFFIDINPETVI